MDLPQISCQSSFFCCQKLIFSGVDSIWTIHWLYQFYAGRLQRFFLKEKKKRKTAPARNMNYFEQESTIAETVSNALGLDLPTVRNEKDKIPIQLHCDI